MATGFNWERLREHSKRQHFGIDTSNFSNKPLEQSVELAWDSDGSWWDNRRLLADRAVDIISNLLIILKAGDKHDKYLILIEHLQFHFRVFFTRSKKPKTKGFQNWLANFIVEQSKLIKEWKAIKIDLSFTYTEAQRSIQQQNSFIRLFQATPWYLERFVGI